jgi:hypothetical protein
MSDTVASTGGTDDEDADERRPHLGGVENSKAVSGNFKLAATSSRTRWRPLFGLVVVGLVVVVVGLVVVVVVILMVGFWSRGN